MALDPSIALNAGNRRRRDPSQEYANALAIKQAQGQIEAQKAEQVRQNALREAVGRARNPDGSVNYNALQGAMLDVGDVDRALSIGKGQADMATAETTSELKSLELAREKIGMAAQLLGSARDDQTYQVALQRAGQMGLPVEGAPAQFDPAWVQGKLQQTLTAKEQLDAAFKEREFAERRRHNQATEARGGMRFSMGPDGTFTFSQGGPGGGNAFVAPDKTVGREAQQGVVSGTETLDRLDRILSTYDPKFLTYQGQAQAGVAGLMDKAGMSSPEQRDLIAKRRKFSQNVNREFNAYRKEITGAAAAVSELEALKEAIINMDLSPTEFESALAEYRRGVARSLRLKRRLLREGVNVGDPKFGKRLDSMFFDGSDDDAQARGAELEAKGLNDQQIVESLQREGYLK